MKTTNEIKCAKCGSTQFTSNKKGFSGVKALGGAVLTGGIGLLAGTHGSGKIKITCLSCGHSFKPGQDKDSQEARLAETKEKWAEFGKIAKKPVVKYILTALGIFAAIFVLMMIIVLIAFS